MLPHRGPCSHARAQNYLFKMRFSPDYKGVDEAAGLADFKVWYVDGVHTHGGAHTHAQNAIQTYSVVNSSYCSD
eukprot:364213-Chlamydomonas_euryale.AAC.6